MLLPRAAEDGDIKSILGDNVYISIISYYFAKDSTYCAASNKAPLPIRLHLAVLGVTGSEGEMTVLQLAATD